MIEIIYQGEEEKVDSEVDVKLPKNVRQIGDCENEDRKIYVEDYVMAYVKRFNSRNMKYGVLLGDMKRNNGITYMFIKGAVCAKPVIDNDIIFDEDVWTGLYEDIKTFFDNVEIVGWFLSIPGVLSGDMAQIQKLHLDNFAGNDKVFFMLDRVECEDSFYVYSDGGMKKSGGHYIYYEKNADMQSYMVMNEEISEIPKDYEQSRKRIINAKVHKLLYKTGTQVNIESTANSRNDGSAERKGKAGGAQNANVNTAEIDDNKKKNECVVYQSIEEKNEGTSGRRLPTFAFSASSFMIIAILLAAVALMNASGQLGELKAVVAGIGTKDSSEKETAGEAKIIEVGNDLVPSAGNDENSQTGTQESGLTNSGQDNEQNSDSQQNGEQTASTEPDSGKENEQNTDSEQQNGQGSGQNTGSEQQSGQGNEQNTESGQETTQQESGGQNTETAANTEPEPTVVPASANRTYVVKKGDSLYSISIKEYGNSNMVDNIMQINGIADGNRIKEGDIILLP